MSNDFNNRTNIKSDFNNVDTDIGDLIYIYIYIYIKKTVLSMEK